jgi:hypothetical protein
MKYTRVFKAANLSEEDSKWKHIVVAPLLLGIAFGTGCYIAKFIINCPLMNTIVNATAEGMREKVVVYIPRIV